MVLSRLGADGNHAGSSRPYALNGIFWVPWSGAAGRNLTERYAAFSFRPRLAGAATGSG